MLQLDNSFSFRGQRVAWGSMGEGDPVVLIHGFPWSAQAWRRIAPWLAGTSKVYYFDMLGFGQSEMADGQKVDESVQSDLLEALISHWGLKRPRVVGHDFGGLAALRGHFVNGIDYGRLHLVDPVAVLPSGSPFYAHVAHHEAAFAGLPDYAHDALFKAYIQQAAHYPLRKDAMEIYAAPWRGDAGKAAFYRQIAQADPGNISEAEARYRKPDFDVHLIWGEHDTFIPVERGEKLRRMLSADSFTVIPGAAHIVQEDAPEALLGALLQHL
ncbi:alpha/beta fold hydrolase [Roseibium sp. Sym1]|uniref:alpha/beta fold hydrolase n=1 Tax=Roseibium sp. Sym1 TaxID=3016006 RepID=UPI0022B47B29|nr:alpha/beta hydrolase [Roseibium sp. Sym1]